MTFNELLPVLYGNDSVNIHDGTGEIADCGDMTTSNPVEFCYEQLKEQAKIIGEREVVKVRNATVFMGLDITIK